jgi:hypothetical protein
MSAPALPTNWRVENLGLIAAVRFTARDGRELLWCDGAWRVGSAGRLRPAPGLPPAATMRQARQVGIAFIVKSESEGEA